MPSENESSIVRFDPNLLKHAVDNLLTNALKFSEREVIVNLHIFNSTVDIGIDDDGPGIPKSERKDIFKAYATLESTQAFGKHIGLGLAIAKEIVDLHAGTLTVTKSELLGGSRFIIQLPKL